MFDTIDCSRAGNKHFLGHVELPHEEIGFEPVVNGPLFFGHAPPGEVELLPGSAVCYSGGEAVVGFRTVELLRDVITILLICDATSDKASEYGALTERNEILFRHALLLACCRHSVMVRPQHNSALDPSARVPM